MEEFQTPILFLIFNRPDTAQKVFDQIKKIRPKKLFVAADGPRYEVVGEYEKCMEAKGVVNQIDWNCQVYTLFREKNLGCGKAVSSAIDWFFSNVEEGIILEDDCVPDMSFFHFCEYILEKYRYNKTVMMISGISYLFNKIRRKYSYFFLKYYAIWGWATWKRAWSLYDFNIESWKNCRKQQIEKLELTFKNYACVKFWKNNFDSIIDKKVDTWDFQWCHSCICNDGLAIAPLNNIISNVGDLGVHSTNSNKFLRMLIKPIDLNNIIDPAEVKEDRVLTKLVYKNVGVVRPFFFAKGLKNLLRKTFGFLQS